MTEDQVKKISTILDAANTALELTVLLQPVINDLKRQGVITVDEQTGRLALIGRIRRGEAFSGPEWQPGTPASSDQEAK